MGKSQLTFSFSSIRNSELFSNHWLEHRLSLESEWEEHSNAAFTALEELVQLWKAERHRVERYGKEAPLEKAFIQPVFEALGWKLIYQCHLRGRKPDYALFKDDAAMDAALNITDAQEEFWQHPTMLADAKAWDISLDRPTITRQQKEYPPEQIEWYLNHSHLDYAILTNGRLWRLVPRNLDSGQPRFQTYLECNLEKLLNERLSSAPQLPKHGALFGDFLRFYLFFSPVAFKLSEERPSLIERARKGSNIYRVGVGEELKPRVFDALSLCIEGFLNHPPNGLLPEHDLETAREQSFTLLYRLLFVLFAEDRKLLPYGVNPAYTANRSLGRLRDDIAAKLGRVAAGRENDYPKAQADLWPDLLALFDLIDGGKKSYGVPAYNGGLFDEDQHPFLKEKVLPDWWLARVIDQLSRAVDPLHPDLGLFRVDYRDLAIQHLGNVYEGLLELRPHYATEDMIVIRNRSSKRGEETVQPALDPLTKGYERTGIEYSKNRVYLLTDKGERRESGSYYTPNHIVDYIVEKTLGPLCDRVSKALADEIAHAEGQIKLARGENRETWAANLETLRGEFDDRILALRVVDPAMGSGHFLIRACQYLAEQIATNPFTRDPAGELLAEDESVIVYWKRKVAESCLYGVDRNPMAVELAKLALWLETVAATQPLTFLDHHLRHGDSLIGAGVDDLGAAPGASSLWSGFAEQQIKQRLPALLKTLAMIRRIPSDTVEQVKEKDKLYRNSFEPTREPFRQTADVWCSAFFLPAPQRVGPEQYKALIDTLDKPPKFKVMMQFPPFSTALDAMGRRGIAAFHWQLEFPEVFFGDAGIRADAGFDAVIGNPPYDVLSEKETGRDLSALQAFIKAMPVYKPSLVGKNNLYKLFICRAIGMIAQRGRLGFITPMAVLGDESTSEIRRSMLHHGAFETIEGFPQKDDPERRVFSEAKLSTAIFVYRVDVDSKQGKQEWNLRVHPANFIGTDSPSLKMAADQVPLYDPQNLTIVSCSQQDWELAIRLKSAGRVRRLGEFASFSQGEVNETVTRAAGHLLEDGKGGQLVVRGANITLYVPRPASQGNDIYLNVNSFLKGKGMETKAYHHLHRRVGLQESCPQNNFRRIIASLIQVGEFCNHKVNYVAEHKTTLPLELVLGLLNSKLSDWYFRLGSTNAAVSHYQLENLPCPVFATTEGTEDQKIFRTAMTGLERAQFAEVMAVLALGLKTAPFSLAIRKIIIEAVQRIIAIEANRGEISRSDRSALAPAAQPYQDLIDRLFYRMAGLSDVEAQGLEERLEKML